LLRLQHSGTNQSDALTNGHGYGVNQVYLLRQGTSKLYVKTTFICEIFVCSTYLWNNMSMYVRTYVHRYGHRRDKLSCTCFGHDILVIMQIFEHLVVEVPYPVDTQFVIK
jgi:hypothetical protein